MEETKNVEDKKLEVKVEHNSASAAETMDKRENTSLPDIPTMELPIGQSSNTQRNVIIVPKLTDQELKDRGLWQLFETINVEENLKEVNRAKFESTQRQRRIREGDNPDKPSTAVNEDKLDGTPRQRSLRGADNLDHPSTAGSSRSRNEGILHALQKELGWPYLCGPCENELVKKILQASAHHGDGEGIEYKCPSCIVKEK